MGYKNKEDLYKAQIFRWRRLKQQAVEYKGGKCSTCGYDSHPAALQFHHRDPIEKEMTWTKLKLKPWEQIKKELDKCDLLCANCHAVLHTVSKYDSQ